MNIGVAKRNKKLLNSKVTKLSLKRKGQELKEAEDSFENFGSFALSVQSSKEEDVLVPTERPNSLQEHDSHMKYTEHLSTDKQVKDFSHFQRANDYLSSQLESILHNSFSLDISAVGTIRSNAVVPDSDESFTEHFSTPCKAKNCSSPFQPHQENKTVVLKDCNPSALTFTRVKNDAMHNIVGSQVLREIKPNNDIPMTTNDTSFITDKHASVLLPLSEEIRGCSETCESKRESVYEDLNEIIIDTVLGRDQKQEKVTLIDSTFKENLGSIPLLADKVTISALGDSEVPVIQQQNTSREEDIIESESVQDPNDHSSPYFSVSDLVCPLCWKKFDKKSVYTSHLKLCATTHSITTKQLLDALELYSKQAAERKALGLPETPSTLRPVPTKKNGPRKAPAVSRDPNLQLALALSVSMKEAEELELEKEQDALIEAGLSEEVMQRQKTLLEKFGFTSSKLPVLESSSNKPGASKKISISTPILMTRSKEERERLITEKVAIILMGKEEQLEVNNTCKNSSNLTGRHKSINSRHLNKLQNKENYLWRKAQVLPDEEERLSYYVSELENFITPSTVITGSKLKNVLDIPCREKTPVKECKKFVDECGEQILPECQENYSNVADENSEVHLRENLANLIEKKDDDIYSDITEWRNVSSASINSSLTFPTLSSAKSSVINNWKLQINNTTMSDITIHVKEGLKIAAHKLVFFAQAPTVLQDISEKSIEQVSSQLYWEDVTYRSAIAFLNYVYCGNLDEIFDLKEDICYVKLLAQRYQMTDLLKHFDNLQNNGCTLSEIGTNFSERKMEENNENRISRGAESEESDMQQVYSKVEKSCTDSAIEFCNSKTKNSLVDSCPYVECSTDTNNPSELEMPKGELCRREVCGSGRSSPDMFLEDQSTDLSVENERDNIDILSSMLCKITPDGNREKHVHTECESSLVHCENENLESDGTGENMECNIDIETKSKGKRKHLDNSSTSDGCESPSKKFCKILPTSDIELGDEFQKSHESDSLLDTIDLTQNSDQSHENNASEHITDNVNFEELNISHTEIADNHSISPDPMPVSSCSHENNDAVLASESLTEEKQDDYVHILSDNSDNLSIQNDVHHFDNFIDSPDSYGTNPMTGSPIELCREEESPESLIPSFTSQINNQDKENDMVEPLGSLVTPLALRCLSKFSDKTVRHSLSQVILPTYENDRPQEGLQHCSQVLIRTPSVESPKSLQQSTYDSVKKMLDDSFMKQIQENSFLRDELLNRSFGLNNVAKSDNASKTLLAGKDYQSVTPKNSPLVSDDVTPLPDYSTMKTPQLKKELHKYGLKQMKRKQAKLILRHIYDELHPLVPVSDSRPQDDTTKVAEERTSITDKTKIAKDSATRKKGQTKRNLLKAISKSPEACSSKTKMSSDTDCEDEALSESNKNANDFSIMIDDKEVFQEQCDSSDDSDGVHKVDLQSAVKRFITGNPEFHEKILLYEPIWLNDLRTGLKANKVKFKINDLMDFLDEQCITYRTASGSHQRGKTRKKKKGKAAGVSQEINANKEDNSFS